MRLASTISVILLATCLVLEPIGAGAQEQSTGDMNSEGLMQETDPITTGVIARDNDLIQYCYHAGDRAAELRASILKERLEALEKEIDERVALLVKRTEETRLWVERRENFIKRANESLIGIFQSMRPDAAAAQMSELGPALSAAIITKLEAKYASAILTEMDAEQAAKVVSFLTSISKEN